MIHFCTRCSNEKPAVSTAVPDKELIIIEVVVSKWGNSPAIRLPKSYLQKLGIKENDTVKISIRGNLITIEKQVKVRSFRDIALSETGLNLEYYVQENPYNNSIYLEFARAGGEEI